MPIELCCEYCKHSYRRKPSAALASHYCSYQCRVAAKAAPATVRKHTLLALDLPDEEWRPVVGWEDIYTVSSFGRLKRIAPVLHGGRLAPYILRGSHHSAGYLETTLAESERQERVYLHGLVAAAFLGPRPAGGQVNHIDGDKTNNRLENLEYCSSAANIRHAYRMGLNHTPRGARNANAKYTAAFVRQLRAEYQPWVVTARILADRYGLSRATVQSLLTGANWRWLEKNDGATGEGLPTL